MKTSIALAAALLTAVSTGAMAADAPVMMHEPMSMDISSPDALAWYASAKIGVALPGELDTRSPGTVNLNGKTRFKAGVEGSLAIGRYLTPNVRAEVEAAYGYNEADSFTGTVTAPAGAGGNRTFTGAAMTGNVQRITVSALGYYDFTQFGDFVPYVGAGAGVSRITATNLSVTGGAGTVSGTDTVPVLQAAIGFNYNISDSFAFGLEYNAQIGPEAKATYDLPAPLADQTLYTKVMSHALSASLTGKF